MYTPKLMMIIFNLILMVVSAFSIFRGTYNNLPPKTRVLQFVTGTKSFTRICSVGGLMLFTLTLFGIWCADSESRQGLVTYKVLMFFMLGLEVVLIFYYGFEEDTLYYELKNEITSWSITNPNDKKKLDMVQLFFRCCENPSRDSDHLPQSCCQRQDVRCTRRKAHPRLCSTVASDYFRFREARYTWFISRITFPEFASIIFADMVLRKITALRNALLRK